MLPRVLEHPSNTSTAMRHGCAHMRHTTTELQPSPVQRLAVMQPAGCPSCHSSAPRMRATCPRGAVGQRAADGGAQRCTFTHQQWLPHNFEPNGSPPGCSRHRSLRRHTFGDSRDERACVRAPQPPSQPMAARALAMPQGSRLAKLPARLLPSAASTRSDPWPLPAAVERSLDASGF